MTIEEKEAALDWADKLALDIMSMVHGRSVNDARRIIAMELRFLKVKSATRAKSQLAPVTERNECARD